MFCCVRQLYTFVSIFYQNRGPLTHVGRQRAPSWPQNQNCTVFAASYAKFEREYLCTGSTCATVVLQCKTLAPVLVNHATKTRSCMHSSADRRRQFCRKSACTRYLTTFCTHCVGVGVPIISRVLKGAWFYRIRIALVLYVHILGARGPAISLMTLVMSKTVRSPTPKFGADP